MKIQAIDLFCGVGGLTHGLKKSGIKVKLGVDIDPACKYPYEKNNNASCLIQDIKNVSSIELESYFTKKSGYKLLAGCAPCQTFSSYNQKAASNDNRWWLLREFTRVVKQINPELVTIENVPKVVEHSVFKEFLKVLRKQNYEYDFKALNCFEYGIPQNRQRLVLIASRLGPIKILAPSKFKQKATSVADAIRGLPKIRAGEIHHKDPLHQSSAMTDLNMKRIIASTPGGTWRDWPSELIADCHKKNSGKSYPSVYGRMKWEEPAPTITTQFFGFGNGRFGHPEQNRAISLREGAIIQSFPHNYKFVAPNTPISKTRIGRLIGNAVPVRLGYVIGCSFRAHLRSIDKTKESAKK